MAWYSYRSITPTLFAFGEFYCTQLHCVRSDIRLTPSGIRFASFGGEYNITEAVRLQYHCRLRQYHADEVGISLKTFPTELKFWTDSNRHTPSEAFQKSFPFTICLQSHRCNGILDRFELTNEGVKVPCLTAWRYPYKIDSFGMLMQIEYILCLTRAWL